MRIRLNRQTAGLAMAGLGVVTLLLTSGAAGASLASGATRPCLETVPPTVEDCPPESPTPSGSASESPSDDPSATESSSEEPTEEPTEEPSETASATESSSEEPSETASPSESACPTGTGSEEPTEEPTDEPSETESPSESTSPSESPSPEDTGGLPTGILTTILDIPGAPIPGVTSATPTNDPTATETSDPEPTECPTAPTGAATVITYAATRRIRFADLYTFSAKVTKAGGLPVSGGTVNFLLPGFTFTGPVGSDGYARVRTRIAINPANYRMNLRYNPAEGFQESREQVGFVVVKTASSCELYRQITSTQSKLTGALRYPDRSRIPGVGVVFWYNGRPLANRVTDSIGVARLDTTRGRRGDTFTFAYPGDSKRGGCSTTIRVP